MKKTTQIKLAHPETVVPVAEEISAHNMPTRERRAVARPIPETMRRTNGETRDAVEGEG